MAFNVQQIDPIDFQPSVAVGVGLPFSAGNVFNSTYTTQNALKANLINFFLTDTGERFLNPNLGAGLRTLLFDQMTQDNMDEVESAIRVGLTNWFTNITLIDVNIEQSQDTNTVTIFMKYKINKTNVQDQLVINFQQ
jgi:phage baseplate assembly protein W